MEWLVRIRESKKMSQKELSEAVGISQPALCQIETGKNMPSVDTAKKIAAVLGFEWTRFFEDEAD